MRLRRILKDGARRSGCLDSLGQYNMLDICTDADKKDDLRGKVAKMIGLGNQWQKLHYSSTVPVSDSMKALVLGEIRKRNVRDLRNSRGKWILEEKGMYKDLKRIADDTELDRSIIVWHLATDLFLSVCPDSDEEARDNIRVLSNHMMFLMVVHPYLLPVVVRNDRYKQNLKYFESLWWVTWKTKKEDTKNMSRSEIVKKIAEFQLAAHSWHKYIFGSGEESSYDRHGRAVYIEACWLAGMLLGNRWRLTFADMLEVIAGVWVEMMCYAIHYCGEESHAKKLSTGAEFISVVWLVIEHAILNDVKAPSAERSTGGLDPFKSERKRKRPATDPGATLYPSLWVDRRGINGVPPGVDPAYSIFF